MTPLAYDPSAETSTTISGLLYKRSDHVKQWRLRYFILHLHDDMEGSCRSKNVTAATLRYYIPKSSNSNNNDYHNGYNNDEKSIDEEDGFDNNDDFKSIDKERPKKVITLNYGCTQKCVKCSSLMENGKTLFAFEIHYKTSKNVKKLYLAATSEEEQRRWMDIFSKRLMSASDMSTVPALVNSHAVVPENVTNTVEKDMAPGIELYTPQPQSQAENLLEVNNIKDVDNDVMKKIEVDENVKKDMDMPIDFEIVGGEAGDVVASNIFDERIVPAPTSAKDVKDETFFDSVPDPIINKVESSVSNFLQMCDEPLESWNDDSSKQAAVFVKRGVTVVQRTMPDGVTQIVRGDAIIPHHPKICFDAILDLNKKKAYEKHLHFATRLQRLNNHTYIDYLRYIGAWPSTPRDFCYVLHWRVLPERNNSIVIVAVDHEDNELCPQVTDAVRGEVFLSGYLLTPVHKENDEKVYCKFQRISAVNIKGIIPASIMKSVNIFFALFPSKLSRYLTAKLEVNISDYDLLLSEGDISTEIIVRDVLSKMPTTFDSLHDGAPAEIILPTSCNNSDEMIEEELADELKVDHVFERPNIHEQPNALAFAGVAVSIILTPSVVWFLSNVIAVFSNLSKSILMKVSSLCTLGILLITFRKLSKISRQQTDMVQAFNTILKIMRISILLFAPVYFKHIGKVYNVPHWEFFVLYTMFCSIRSIVCFILGSQVMHSSSGAEVGYLTHRNLGTGTVTCRFTIDLKRILYYVSEKKKADREGVSNENDISVTHVCIRAIAKALSDMPSLNARRVSIPWLGIKGLYPNKKIDISVSTSGAAHDTVKLVDVGNMTTREVVNELAQKTSGRSRAKRKSSQTFELLSLPFDRISEVFDIRGDENSFLFKGRKFGSCVIITAPDTSGQIIDIDVNASREFGMPSIVVVIGGIRLTRTNETTPDGKRLSRPSLSFSISIDSPACGIMACKKFVERFQRLMLHPENIDPDRRNTR